MGCGRYRPITGTTPAGTGATYIVVECEENSSIQVIANGTVTFTVDYTLENILYDATAQSAVNIGNPNGRYVAPASAVWTNLIASGSADAQAALVDGSGNQIVPFAFRINITVGTGSVTYTITQG